MHKLFLMFSAAMVLIFKEYLLKESQKNVLFNIYTVKIFSTDRKKHVS